MNYVNRSTPANCLAAYVSPMLRGLACMTIVSLVSIGCGKPSAEVHGRITVNGTPVTNAVVYFVPTSGPQAQARLEGGGEYTLVTPGKGKGVAPGVYRVFFAPMISEADEAAKESISQQDYLAGKLPKLSKAPPSTVLPPKFLSSKTSNLSREVRAGANQIDFELAKE
jgi:hypothetical protein